MRKLTTALALLVPIIFTAGTAGASENPAIEAGSRCASCGMEVLKYPGPKGVLVAADGRVKTFCSARAMACALVTTDGDARAAYVHDAGRTGWENPEDSAFIDAKSAHYVYGSGKRAVMGPSLAPFSSVEAARAFQKEHGGTFYEAGELTAAVLGCRAHN